MTEDLKRRLAELEALVRRGPSVAEPAQHWDPTANMRMPRNALTAMVAADSRPMSVAERRAAANIHQLPPVLPEAGPRDRGGTRGGVNGWREALPLGPQPGIRLVDQIAESFAQRDRRR